MKVGPVEDVVAVYVFDIKYFRESDMKEFTQKNIYFVDSGKVYSHNQYRNQPDYRTVMVALEKFKDIEANHHPQPLPPEILKELDKVIQSAENEAENLFGD